jgi:uncharacterized protein YbaP (TraB family)
MKNKIAAVLVSLLGLLAFTFALAQAQPKPALAALQPHPSLWHIKGEAGEIYLLGSVHVLPSGVNWRTPEISRALARSDVFVFEVPEDEASLAQLNALIQAKGFLPPGDSLRAKLHAASLPDYDTAVKVSGLTPDAIERERPWLAGLQLMFAQIAKLKFSAKDGVDTVLMADAAKDHKQTRYLETIAEQFALLAPDDPMLELQEFESGLKDLRDIGAGIDPMVQAWSNGNQAALDKLINGDLDEFPQARKMLLDDRNKHWMPKLEAMLKERHIFFVTVGAGHLTGPLGLPALLRKDGHRVDGP